MAESSLVRCEVDRRPLTNAEHSLIVAATTQRWTWELLAMLRGAVENRGVRVGPYENCGDLVDALEMIAKAR